MDNCNLINVLPTLFYQCWNNEVLSAVFQRYLVNVETASINVRRINFHFQPMSILNQLWWMLTINVVSTFIGHWCVSWVTAVRQNCYWRIEVFMRILVRPLAVTKLTRVFFWQTSNGNQMHWKQLDVEE